MLSNFGPYKFLMLVRNKLGWDFLLLLPPIRLNTRLFSVELGVASVIGE